MNVGFDVVGATVVGTPGTVGTWTKVGLTVGVTDGATVPIIGAFVVGVRVG